MALPNTGAISIGDIAAEFGGVSPHSLSEYYSAGSGIPTSGEISVSDFYGASAATFIEATGGSVSTSGNYKFHTFTSGSSQFNVTQTASGGASNVIDLCLVAGAGGGGESYYTWPGGGGGAGGMVEASEQAVLGELTVKVGSSNWGGRHTAQYGARGGADSGGVHKTCGSAGGKAGRYGQNAGIWTPGQGHEGGASKDSPFTSGGGGGAGAKGGTTGGGSGRTWSLNGTTYAKGGNGSVSNGSAGANANFYGNGGGGSGGDNGAYGQGYQGIVICRYQYQ